MRCVGAACGVVRRRVLVGAASAAMPSGLRFLLFCRSGFSRDAFALVGGTSVPMLFVLASRGPKSSALLRAEAEQSKAFPCRSAPCARPRSIAHRVRSYKEGAVGCGERSEPHRWRHRHANDAVRCAHHILRRARAALRGPVRKAQRQLPIALLQESEIRPQALRFAAARVAGFVGVVPGIDVQMRPCLRFGYEAFEVERGGDRAGMA